MPYVLVAGSIFFLSHSNALSVFSSLRLTAELSAVLKSCGRIASSPVTIASKNFSKLATLVVQPAT